MTTPHSDAAIALDGAIDRLLNAHPCLGYGCACPECIAARAKVVPKEDNQRAVDDMRDGRTWSRKADMDMLFPPLLRLGPGKPYIRDWPRITTQNPCVEP